MQFKRPVLMTGVRARERQEGLFTEPFYRVHLHSARRSRQHHFLCELETSAAGSAVVYYVAPTFHTQDEFNRHSAAGSVTEHSFHALPSDAGHFEDDHQHHFAFVPGGVPYYCSRPRPVSRGTDRATFRGEVATAARLRGDQLLSRDALSNIGDTILQIVEQSADDRRRAAVARQVLDRRDAHPLERLETLARTFLGCALLVAQPARV